MRKALPFLFVLLSIGAFVLTYNFVTMVGHYQRGGFIKWLSSESSNQLVIDPLVEMPGYVKKPMDVRQPFHVALTATDSLYSKWQCRIMYYWYKKMKDLPGSNMGSFTRILHSGRPDNLMDEIPTFVVDPLPEGLDKGYIVLNRPWAFVQWLEKSTIEEEYILMAEPDHIFLKPLPNLVYGEYPAAFPFFYIKPSENENIMRKFFPEEMGPVTNIDPIGNSPVIIKRDLLEKIAPTWMNVSLRMKNDAEADATFGWVLEMYGYAVASALHGVQHILRKDFMLQPPWDMGTRDKFILHYTYGCDYNLKGQLTYGKIGEWRFDKRTYIQRPPPRYLALPPRGVPESVILSIVSHLGEHGFKNIKDVFPLALRPVTLIKMINEATANLPNWETAEEVYSSKKNRSQNSRLG